MDSWVGEIMPSKFEITDSVKLRLDCSYNSEGVIELTTHGFFDNIVKKVIDTQEQQVREALIALGWTPPKDPA